MEAAPRLVTYTERERDSEREREREKEETEREREGTTIRQHGRESERER